MRYSNYTVDIGRLGYWIPDKRQLEGLIEPSDSSILYSSLQIGDSELCDWRLGVVSCIRFLQTFIQHDFNIGDAPPVMPRPVTTRLGRSADPLTPYGAPTLSAQSAAPCQARRLRFAMRSSRNRSDRVCVCVFMVERALHPAIGTKKRDQNGGHGSHPGPSWWGPS